MNDSASINAPAPRRGRPRREETTSSRQDRPGELAEKLGGILRQARERRGRKQQRVAEDAGITSGVLSAYESGRYAPNLPNLLRLAAVLGIDLGNVQRAIAPLVVPCAPAGPLIRTVTGPTSSDPETERESTLPTGWVRPPGSVWLVGSFEFPTTDAAAAGLARVASLPALREARRVAVRLEERLLVVRTSIAPRRELLEADQALLDAIGRAAEAAGGRPVTLGPEPASDRSPEAVQGVLRRIAAEVLRLEGTVEDLAAEAVSQARGDSALMAPTRVLWRFLEASLQQLLADNFGPLVEELRATATADPRELRGEELVPGEDLTHPAAQKTPRPVETKSR